ncbi:hypothetical protein ACFV0Q_27395, partial [Streptomyces sp. NPDC059564]
GRRRPRAVTALLLAAVLAAGIYGVVRWLPDGDLGSSAKPGGGATGPAVATPAGSTPSGSVPAAPPLGPRTSSSASPSAAPKGSLLTPDRVRTALAALKAKTGTTTFAKMTVYDEYVLASVPTSPGARTLDLWQYRGGAVTRSGPSGTVKDGDPVIDMAAVNWDALPGLLEQGRRELEVPYPTSSYVIVEPWMMDQIPCMRPYLSDAYGQGGYLLAGIDGTVRKAVHS